jgi:hypothetical protein
MEKQLKNEILADLKPEELEPRLELQVVLDPITTTTTFDNNCRDGGNCNVPQQVPPIT